MEEAHARDHRQARQTTRPVHVLELRAVDAGLPAEGRGDLQRADRLLSRVLLWIRINHPLDMEAKLQVLPVNTSHFILTDYSITQLQHPYRSSVSLIIKIFMVLCYL